MSTHMLRHPALPAALVFLASLGTIASAWAFQLIGGYIPCALCLQERIPYYIGVPLALVTLAAVLRDAPEWLWRVLLVLLVAVFLYGAYLGTYHAGAEYRWWPGPADCGSTGTMDLSGDLMNQIKNIQIVSCTDPTWRFPEGWGLSFAGWNAVVSAGLVVVAAFGALFGRKPAKPAA